MFFTCSLIFSKEIFIGDLFIAILGEQVSIIILKSEFTLPVVFPLLAGDFRLPYCLFGDKYGLSRSIDIVKPLFLILGLTGLSPSFLEIGDLVIDLVGNRGLTSFLYLQYFSKSFANPSSPFSTHGPRVPLSVLILIPLSLFDLFRVYLY